MQRNKLWASGWNALAMDDRNVIVGVGKSDYAIVSNQSGLIWKRYPIDSIVSEWTDVCCDRKGRFIAVGNHTNLFAISDGGTKWYTIMIELKIRDWVSIEYCTTHKKYVALSKCGMIAVSRDGLDWTIYDNSDSMSGAIKLITRNGISYAICNNQKGYFMNKSWSFNSWAYVDVTPHIYQCIDILHHDNHLILLSHSGDKNILWIKHDESSEITIFDIPDTHKLAYLVVPSKNGIELLSNNGTLTLSINKGKWEIIDDKSGILENDYYQLYRVPVKSNTPYPTIFLSQSSCESIVKLDNELINTWFGDIDISLSYTTAFYKKEKYIVVGYEGKAFLIKDGFNRPITLIGEEGKHEN